MHFFFLKCLILQNVENDFMVEILRLTIHLFEMFLFELISMCLWISFVFMFYTINKCAKIQMLFSNLILQLKWKLKSKTDNKTIRNAIANKSWYCHFYKNWLILNQCRTVIVTIFSNWKYCRNFVFVIILALTSLYIVQFKNYYLGHKLKTVYTRLPLPFFS